MSKEGKQPTYLSIVANAFRAINAWRSATFALSFCLLLLSFGYVKMMTSAPTYVIPYNLASADKEMKLQASGELDPEYLSLIAIADLKLLTDFTPRNVTSQYSRFLNRLTPDLYAAENVRLTTEARANASGAVTQSFHQTSSEVDVTGNKVTIKGVLIRWEGEKEVLRKNTGYFITYETNKGFARVSYVEIFNAEEK